MNNRRRLIAAVFHLVHTVEKDMKKHHKLTQNSVNFSFQSKQSINQSINQLYLNTVNGLASWFSDMPCDNYNL